MENGNEVGSKSRQTLDNVIFFKNKILIFHVSIRCIVKLSGYPCVLATSL